MKQNADACKILNEIAKACDGETLFNEPMAKHTTWRIGGPADLWIAPDSLASVLKILAICTKAQVPWTIIGSGSNVLVSDEGYRGVIINIEKAANQLDVSGTTVEAGAGRPLSDLDRTALEHNLAGPEHWAGIPGTIGGAIAGNAGAFGAETCNFATDLHLATSDGDGWIPMTDIPYHYRHCGIEANTIVMAAKFAFTDDAPESIRSRRSEYTMKRVENQPTGIDCAGSVFRNPEHGRARAFLDAAGLKGFSQGGAQVSEKHANFIINKGGASAQDVLWLIAEMQRRVAETANVSLETEIHVIGTIETERQNN